MKWWRNRSIRFKVATGIGLIVLPLLAGIIFGISQFIQAELWRRETIAAENLNNIASTLVSDSMMAGHKETIQDTLINLGNNVGGQFDSIAIYDDQFLLTSFASGFPGGRKVDISNYQIDISDPTCWVCHQLPPEERPLMAVVSVDGQDILRSVVPLVNEPRCQTCHGSGLELLGDSIVDLRLDRYQQNTQTLIFGLSSSIAVFIVFLVFILIQFSQRVVINPLEEIVKVSRAMMLGDLNRQVVVQSKDEIGQLGTAFNDMSSQINNFVQTLEQRVAERTTELEESAKHLEKRAGQFESIALLARTITSIQDAKTLLSKITELVSERFGFYHVGLFLLDESRKYAVLNAANSEGGQRMLARKHRLEVGQTGIVGFVTATGNPRIALDTGTDAVYFDNPDLPETRSEMALPLRIGRTIIGALDVQSTEANAFSEDDIETLSILADEVSIAIENARLFEESQRVLLDAQTAFGEFTQEAWRKLSKSRKIIGYELSGTEIRPFEQFGKTIDSSSVEIPILLRDHVIGTINIVLPDNNGMDEDEIDITQALAERVGVAIESATLLEDSRRRATRESVIGDISAKLSATAEIERLMQVAVVELRDALGASEVNFKLNKLDEPE